MARDVMHVILEMCRMMYVEMIMLCELFNLRSVFIIRYLCSNTHVHVCCFLTYMHILLQATSLTTLHFLCLLLLFISLGLTHNTRNFTHARTHTHTIITTTNHTTQPLLILPPRRHVHPRTRSRRTILPPPRSQTQQTRGCRRCSNSNGGQSQYYRITRGRFEQGCK